MDKNLMNISAIEAFFRRLLYKNVSNNIFFGNEPETIQSSWTDFVVVDCSTTMRNMDAYSRGIVNILLYSAKNLSNGSKNRNVIENLEKKLNESVENNSDSHYRISSMGSMGDYNPTNNLYYNVVFLNLSIY